MTQVKTKEKKKIIKTTLRVCQNLKETVMTKIQTERTEKHYEKLFRHIEISFLTFFRIETKTKNA